MVQKKLVLPVFYAIRSRLLEPTNAYSKYVVLFSVLSTYCYLDKHYIPKSLIASGYERGDRQLNNFLPSEI